MPGIEVFTESAFGGIRFAITPVYKTCITLNQLILHLHIHVHFFNFIMAKHFYHSCFAQVSMFNFDKASSLKHSTNDKHRFMIDNKNGREQKLKFLKKQYFKLYKH